MKFLISRLKEILLALLTILCTVSTAGLAQLPQNEAVVFPSGAEVINVKSAPYNAKGDGVTDDTQVIQSAIENNRGKLIYFPNGTYLVSQTIRCKATNGKQKRFFLQGQSQSGAIIKLKDSAAGFEKSEKPKPVITYWEGRVGDATAFRNTIRNMTIDIGRNNPGAIGLRFRANNYGSVEDVTIKSTDKTKRGKYGLDLSVGLNGPLLVKNLTVVGFDYGVYFTGALHSATIDGLTLRNQRTYGLYNKRQVLSVHKLTSTNSVPAIKNDHDDGNYGGLLTLVSSTLNGGSPANAAIDNAEGSGLYVRNLTTSGYKYAIKSTVNGTTNNKFSPVGEFVSHDILSVFPSSQTSLNLPIEDTPEVVWEDPTNWAKVDGSDRDDTSAIQAAIDSGKTTVYFPTANYTISNTIQVRGNVKRIVGIGAAKLTTSGTLRNSSNPVFQVVNGTPDTVTIEGFETNLGSAFFVEHASRRTLVLRHMGAGGYRNTSSGNKLFMEDVVGGRWYFKNQKVWGRQLNVEMGSESGNINIENDGSDLWIMGLKTERDATIITTKNGGRTELLGGFLYANRPIPDGTVGFLNNESSQSLIWASYNGDFKPYVREIRNGFTKDLNSASMYPIKYGKMSPLFVGYASASSPARKWLTCLISPKAEVDE